MDSRGSPQVGNQNMECLECHRSTRGSSHSLFDVVIPNPLCVPLSSSVYFIACLGRDRGAYYHESFVRGHPELATRIQRMKLKGIGQGRHRTNAELEPNFYRMSHIDRNTIIATGAGVGTVTSATNLEQPPTLSTVPSTLPTANSALSNATTVNLLQLFQGTVPPGTSANVQVATQGQGSLLTMGNVMNQDLSNLYFITNASELASLQQSLENHGAIVGNANATGGGGLQQPQQQDERQSTQQAFMLADLFNAGSSVGGSVAGAAPSFTNNTGSTPLQQLFALDDSSSSQHHNTGNTVFQQLFALDNGTSGHHRHQHGGDHDALNAAHPSWASAPSTSNYLGGSNSNLLLQSAGDINTAALMQYFSDNSPERDSAPDAPAYGSLQQQTHAEHQYAASGSAAWSSLAAATGLSSTIGAPVASGYDTSAQMIRNYEGYNSSSEFSNAFQFEGPSMRRMSASAMSALLNILGEGNNDTPGATASGNDHPSSYPLGGDSNQNRLLFSNLHNSRNLSSTNLFYQSLMDASMNATTNNPASASQLGPDPPPAGQQLALLNAAAAAGSSANATNNFYVFSDPSRTTASVQVSHPAFLDSVYEPIPIKENPATSNINQHQVAGRIGQNNSAEGIGTGDAAGASQQHKLSPQLAAVGTDPTKFFNPGTHNYDNPS
jgi:hypothetical protein